MAECINCKKKPILKRQLNAAGVCKECVLKNEQLKSQAEAEDREMRVLNEVSQKQAEVSTPDFWQNMKKLLDVKFDNFEKKIEQNVKSSVMADVKVMVEPLDKEIKELKKENKTLKNELTIIKAKQQENSEMTSKLEVAVKEHQVTISRNDKEQRMKRLLVGGIPEEEPFTVGEEEFQDDESKVKAIFKIMNVNTTVQNIRRIGNKDRGNDKRPRFILLEFKSFNERNEVKKASDKLKVLEDTKYIRIKADSSKQERNEYTRLYGIRAIIAEDPDKVVEIKNGKLYVNDEEMDKISIGTNYFLR